MKNHGKQGIWSKSFALLFLLTIFDQMAFLCTRAIISKYSLDLGFTETMAGVIAGALSVSALFSRPLAGSLLAKPGIRHKNILILSVICSFSVVVSYMIFTDYIPLLFVRILNGITYGVSGTVELTMASNTLPEEKMGQGIGIFGLGNIIGLAVAPSIAVFFYNHFGPKMLFMWCIATSLIALGIALRIPEDTETVSLSKIKEKQRDGRKCLKDFFAPEAIVPSVLNLASQIAYASVSAFIVVYGGLKGWEQIGLFYTVYSVSLFVFRPINGRLYDRYGIAPLVVFGNLSFAFGIFLIAVTDSFIVCMLAAVFCAYGYGGAICTFQADAVRSTGPKRRGIASGTYFMFNDLGGFIGSTLAGASVTILGKGDLLRGYSQMYLCFMTPLFAGILFYWTVCLIKKRKTGIHGGVTA